MAFWGLKVEPNTWTPFVPPPEEQLRLHISQVREGTRAKLDGDYPVEVLPLTQELNKLLAGASWMAEYGNPDTADWDDFLWRYSAYHHIDPDAKYPPMLMTTSTRDDRVHPYHARAFVARLRDAGHGATTTYYENIEGGHGGAADPKQSAHMLCLQYDFLAKTIGATLGPLRPHDKGGAA